MNGNSETDKDMSADVPECVRDASRVQSVTASDYMGVVAHVGSDWRVAVGRKGNRYHLQKRGQTRDAEIWAGSYYGASLSSLLASYAAKVPGLSAATAGLPESPADAAPEAVAFCRAQEVAFLATDWRREDYPRVVARQEDWRLVVDPDGQLYRLMFIHESLYVGWGFDGSPAKPMSCDCWITAAVRSSLGGITSLIQSRFNLNAHMWHSSPKTLLPALAAARLPVLASDGEWPVLPERPIPIKAQA